MTFRRLARWSGGLTLAACLALAGQALAQSSPEAQANPQAVLINQPSNSNLPPTNFDASNLVSSNTNSKAADDFVVPNDLFWHITSVTARGLDEGANGDGSGVTSIIVQFYSNSGSSLPGALLYSVSYPSGTYTDLNSGTLVVALNPGLTVGPGHYWFSFQPQVPTCPDTNCRLWVWNESPGQSFAESAWQGRLANNCKTWQPRITVCHRPQDSSGKDIAYELDGNTVPIVARLSLPVIRR